MLLALLSLAATTPDPCAPATLRPGLASAQRADAHGPPPGRWRAGQAVDFRA